MLDSKRWAEVEDLFTRASQLPAHERAEFIDQQSTDQEVRSEVRSLLDHSSDGLPAASAAIQSMAASVVGRTAGPLVGHWIGPYHITALLGQGGMGAVYSAVREDDQFRKRVAIKIIPRALAAPEAVARFRSERQILADLEHPNIARLLDGGTCEGIPYLVMEYVEGLPITQYVAEHALPVPSRLRLLQSVCTAVQYAHRNLVIHRDLKPGNILVTADGTIKLLDFGLAKLMDPTQADTALTSRLMRMTPDYASPEQIEGAPVTTASDVYSLGIVLYEVLTGERPYRVTSSILQDVQRQLSTTEPRKPSTVATLPPRMRRRLAGDLDNIVLKALHKDVTRRYGSVEQFSEDIRRHLEGLPVLARPDSAAYRTRKFMGRHQVAVTSAAILALLVVTGMIAVLWEARQAEVQRARAEQRVGQLAELANRTLFDVHGAIERLPGATGARRKIVVTTLEYLDQLARETGDDARVQSALASAYARLADIEGNPALPSLGDWNSAFTTYQKAVKILDTLHVRDPRNPVYMLRRAQVSRGLAYSLVMFGKTKDALAESARGISSAESYLAIQPDNLEARKLEAQLQADRLGTLSDEDPAAAEKDGLRLLPKYAALAARFPNDPDVLAAYAGAQTAVGITAALLNRRADALRYCQQAAQLLETANRLRPNDVMIQRLLLRNYGHVAQALAHQRAAPQTVLEYMQKGERMAEALQGVDSSDFMARVDVAVFYMRMGLIKEPETQIPESLKMLAKAQTVMQSVVAGTPNPLRFKFALVIIYNNEGALLKKLHRNREALPFYRSAVELATSLAASMPGAYADRFLLLASADLGELLATLRERQESRQVAAQVAAMGQRLVKRSPVDVAEVLQQMGDAMSTLSESQAACTYYTQAQQIWAGVPEDQRKEDQERIDATARSFTACQQRLTSAAHF